MLIKDEKGRFPNTTCYCCGKTREQDYTRMFNLSTDSHPYLVDICSPCIIAAENKGGELKDAIKEAHDSIRNPITFRDADGTPSTFEVKDGIIVEAK